MEMKQYLIDTFRFNDQANKMILEKIKELPDKTESIKFFSHLINSQNKWMQRILHSPDAAQMSWWDPVYELGDLKRAWTNSLMLWLDYLESKTEVELFEELTFIGFDGGKWAAKPKDIALQLNY